MNSLTDRTAQLRSWQRALVFAAVGVLALSITRVVAGADDLTSGTTFIAMIAAGAPILFVALGGLYSERSGIANIGLEGMMTLGTWGAAWAGWHWGPWAALVGGAVFGMFGGLLHALATVTFGVDQIVSGVAINLIAPGITRFLASEIFDGQGQNHEGTITTSPAIKHSIGKFTFPGLADGLKSIDKKRWFFVSDVAGLLRGFVDSVDWSTMIALLLVPISIYVLWRTPFGLRLRSIGEKPSAAESVGVSVYRMKYIALIISGSLAGLGGAWLVLNIRQYGEGQTAGRGFLGLAALIFGNWQPVGVLLGSMLFSYGFSLNEAIGTKPVKALYGLIAAGFLLLCITLFLRSQSRKVAIAMGFAGGGLLAFVLKTNDVNTQLVYITPYLVVLVVITLSSSRSRPPAAVGQVWRPGST